VWGSRLSTIRSMMTRLEHRFGRRRSGKWGSTARSSTALMAWWWWSVVCEQELGAALL
jgi:hypothetical protein